jgi:hypothetical protein
MGKLQMKTCGLIRFIKGDVSHNIAGCANYDKHCGGCLLWGDCKVEKGQRCSYFEKAVLPLSAQLGIKESILAAYSVKTGLPDVLKIVTREVRYCGCGEVLKPRQRFCDRCAEKHRKQTYRNYRQNKQRLLLTRHS